MAYSMNETDFEDSSSQTFKGIAYKLLSVVLLSSMLACIKATANAVPPGQAVFIRALLAVPIVLFWLSRRGSVLEQISTPRPLKHMLRGVLGGLAMVFAYAAAGLLPLAQATALSYGTPVFTVGLAIVILGEPKYQFRLLGISIGLLGILVVLWPDLLVGRAATAGQVAALGFAAAFASCLTHALALVTTKSLTKTEGTGTIVFWFTATAGAVGLMSSAIPLLGAWRWPDATTWMFLLAAAWLGTFGQLALTSAFRYAHASTIAPFEYASILFAIALGFWAFGEIPSLWTAGGVAIIFAGALVVLRGEKRLERPMPLTKA